MLDYSAIFGSWASTDRFIHFLATESVKHGKVPTDRYVDVYIHICAYIYIEIGPVG